MDDLFVELRRSSPRDARSLLSEAESHLRDAAEEGRHSGMSPTDTEADAVRRFGAPSVARSDRDRGSSVDACPGTAVAAWSLGALGAIAVGAGGLVVGVMRRAGVSNQFLAGGVDHEP